MTDSPLSPANALTLNVKDGGGSKTPCLISKTKPKGRGPQPQTSNKNKRTQGPHGPEEELTAPKGKRLRRHSINKAGPEVPISEEGTKLNIEGGGGLEKMRHRQRGGVQNNLHPCQDKSAEDPRQDEQGGRKDR